MFSLTVTEYYKKKNLISISQLVVVSPKIHNFKSLINQFVSRNRIVVTSVSRRSSSLLLTHCLNYRITSQSTIAYQIHRGLSVNQAKATQSIIEHKSIKHNRLSSLKLSNTPNQPNTHITQTKEKEKNCQKAKRRRSTILHTN